ncbi:unnamed protein product [Dimorphilus gyrociliatus]|uniref:Adenosine 5'-monophosphoramidase HINT3 n=1 Tax=Dimorphilus gyrociliatus TaxID=2664684 RepID=A0A7I8WBY8_9ANNE|nr:unnamed protein product [Dimorphilus gyrociliatus]
MSNDDCIFCKISSGRDEKTQLVYEDEQFVSFKDHKPGSDTHYLVVPKEHLDSCKVLTGEHVDLIKRMKEIGKELVKDVDQNQVRFGFHWPPIILIKHLHLHVIAPVTGMSFMSRLIFRENSWWFVSPEYMIERLTKLK